MKSYSAIKKNLLANKKIRAEYDALSPEFALVEAIIAKRIERGLTQDDLAKRVGTKQSAISRLERGEANPTLDFLKRVAVALDARMSVSLSSEHAGRRNMAPKLR